jgi:predicted nucleic acid-binding protein
MILVDTSVWVDVLRDKEGNATFAFRKVLGDRVSVLARFTQLELLQGAKNEYEWRRLDEYLSSQYYLEALESTWKNAARIYYELRRKGLTITSPIDCCIAQIAIENDVILLHRDQDFTTIAKIRPLNAQYFKY